MDFAIISQEYSFEDPLSNLIKRFRSDEQDSRQSLN